jgi:hypothetical protein
LIVARAPSSEERIFPNRDMPHNASSEPVSPAKQVTWQVSQAIKVTGTSERVLPTVNIVNIVNV